MGVVVGLAQVVSAAPSSAVAVWRTSHRRQSPVNSSRLSPSHGLQFLTNCSSMENFLVETEIRNYFHQAHDAFPKPEERSSSGMGGTVAPMITLSIQRRYSALICNPFLFMHFINVI